ncbi:hypothetical protein F2981_25345 (plasmid) [Sinorhizobium meliloti]|nr:hypothetical protein [Sinorhizobium meliloti]
MERLKASSLIASAPVQDLRDQVQSGRASHRDRLERRRPGWLRQASDDLHAPYISAAISALQEMQGDQQMVRFEPSRLTKSLARSGISLHFSILLVSR